MKRFFAALMAMMLCMTLAAAAAQGTHCNDKNCLVCEVAELINALPAAEEITIDDAATVINQIHAIDRIKMDLTDDEYDELLELVDEKQDVSGGGLGVPARYVDALDAVEALTGVGSLISNKSFYAGGAEVDVSNAQVQFKLTRVDGGRNDSQTLTMSTLNHTASYYAENSDGWTYKYLLAPGMYTLVETGDSGAKVDGKDFVTRSTAYFVNGKRIAEGEAFKIVAGEDCRIKVLNSYGDPPVIVIKNQVVGETDDNLKFSYTIYLKDNNNERAPFNGVVFYNVSDADGNPIGTEPIMLRFDKGYARLELTANTSARITLENGYYQYAVTQDSKTDFETIVTNPDDDRNIDNVNEVCITFINSCSSSTALIGTGSTPDGAAPDLPKTGDDSALGLWLALAAACGATMMLRRREA